MKPALLVATTGWSAERWAQRMRVQLPDRRILCTSREGRWEGATGDLADIRYLLAWKTPQATLDALPALQVIFSLGAGVDHVFGLSRLPDVPVTRVIDDDLTGRMREYVVWQVLHHLRRGALYQRQQQAHVWADGEPPAASEVAIGFMGYGVMARSAADILMQLGFPIRAWTRSPTVADGVSTFHGAAGLEPFLAGTDILVALLPLTPQTTDLLDARLIAGLRRDGPLGGPVLINAGRGGSQVEVDIAAALHDGTLAGASLDVFRSEPLPADSPLWDAPNLVITPHVAAVSNPDAIACQVAAQIAAFESGAGLTNVVDPARGY